MSRLRSKPLLGGPFGTQGRFALASVPCMDRGLHSVTFAVTEPEAGRVLSVAPVKTEAIAAARSLIKATAELSAPPAEQGWSQGGLWDDLPAEEEVQQPPRYPKPVSRRRRGIFDLSNGRCHYCRTTLTLDGTWHVEHMLPSALGGTDDPSNLVAACAPCNLRKRDRTAIEFIALQAANDDHYD